MSYDDIAAPEEHFIRPIWLLPAALVGAVVAWLGASYWHEYIQPPRPSSEVAAPVEAQPPPAFVYNDTDDAEWVVSYGEREVLANSYGVNVMSVTTTACSSGPLTYTATSTTGSTSFVTTSPNYIITAPGNPQ